MLLSDCVEFGAVKHPEKAAVIYEGVETSYAALASRIRQVANAFAGLAALGDRVAILSENRYEYVECLYGIPRAGLSLCLLNYRLTPVELAKILNDAQPSVVITERAYWDTIESIRGETSSVRTVVVVGGESPEGSLDYEVLLAGATDEEPHASVHEADMAWLIYTSGTTGTPKGAMLSHRNVLAANLNTLPSWINRPGDVLLTPWPMCHVAAQIWPLCHMMGWSVVLMHAFDPVEYLSNIERYRCTASTTAPTVINMLMKHPRFGDFDLSSLQTLAYGSAAMSPELLRRAMERLPNVGFTTNFGMTETAGSVYYFEAEDHVRALYEQPEALRSVGFPLYYSVTRLVDEDMHDVPVGEVGEVVVRGPQVMIGYWRNESANEESFRGGWFHTGDLARQDPDGRTYIVDRKKDMIITGGLNVYSREVELVLTSHPATEESAVVGIPDELWGESVVAFVVLRPNESVDEASLIKHCAGKLANYKKPKRVIITDELPRNVTGKVLKRQLRDWLVEGVYEESTPKKEARSAG
jgi:acyl-CoA synthetase (AMP-forming)/AMP-acid ligase II